MSRKLALSAVVALIFAPFGVTQSAAQTAPSPSQKPQHEAGFDCAKASSPVEKAICATASIAEADRAMSVAYKATLASESDPAFIAALRQDQRFFIATRAEAFGLASSEKAALDLLSGMTEQRAEMLNWWHPNTQADLVGKWSNTSGILDIRRDANGILSIQAEAVDQVAGRWVCGFDGALLEEPNGDLRGTTLGGDLILRRNGGVLDVPVPFCDETGPSAFGSFQGSYFRVGAPD